jgi:hypothetical protein
MYGVMDAPSVIPWPFLRNSRALVPWCIKVEDGVAVADLLSLDQLPYRNYLP